MDLETKEKLELISDTAHFLRMEINACGASQRADDLAADIRRNIISILSIHPNNEKDSLEIIEEISRIANSWMSTSISPKQAYVNASVVLEEYAAQEIDRKLKVLRNTLKAPVMRYMAIAYLKTDTVYEAVLYVKNVFTDAEERALEQVWHAIDSYSALTTQ